MRGSRRTASGPRQNAPLLSCEHLCAGLISSLSASLRASRLAAEVAAQHTNAQRLAADCVHRLEGARGESTATVVAGKEVQLGNARDALAQSTKMLEFTFGQEQPAKEAALRDEQALKMVSELAGAMVELFTELRAAQEGRHKNVVAHDSLAAQLSEREEEIDELFAQVARWRQKCAEAHAELGRVEAVQAATAEMAAKDADAACLQQVSGTPAAWCAQWSGKMDCGSYSKEDLSATGPATRRDQGAADSVGACPPGGGRHRRADAKLPVGHGLAV